MPRRNVYFKDKVDQEVKEMVQIEIQKGATHGEMNFSAMVNELVGLGLMIKKHQSEKQKFDEEMFNRDLIRRVAGSREGVSIMMAMLTEMYLQMNGDNSAQRLEDILSENLSAMSGAEDNAEQKHFLAEE